MFKDPKTANSRIYVGNLNDVVSKDDLETLFQKYGTIHGILNQRKFAFVQFDNENEATSAVENENGTMLNSRKLLVRFSEMGKGQNNQQKQQDQQSSGAGRNKNINKKQKPQNRNRDDSRSRSPMNENRNFNSGNEGMGFFGGPPSLLGNNNNNLQNFQPSDYNDCEIIVVSKALTSYAELVEMQLKRVGLTVDLLFPNDDVPIGKVLANIASRGSLYGLLVTPLNEQHRSITVTQLYGDNPTEHRNMPVDEAIKYIYKDFKQKTNDNNTPSPNFPTAIQFNTIVQTPELKEAHPDAIQILLNMLCENRPLTVLQYERLIKYLSERKEMQIKAEIGDDISVSEITNITSAPKVEPVKPDPEKIKQEELQKKILEILNKPSLTETIKKVEEPKPKFPPIKIGQSSNASSASSNSNVKISTDKQNPTQSKLLNDEKVQKALDFLLLGKKH